MKLTIFGASSATGQLLVGKALARGHRVIAFVRNETKLEMKDPNLSVICGNALNASDVASAIQGSDAVLSTLGPKGKSSVMVAESTMHIVTAMQKYGVSRLILVSVAGVPVPDDQRGFNLADVLIKFLLKNVFIDRENQLSVLNASDLDWVAVRVPRLTNDPATGSVKAFFGKPSPRMKISRADLADFMLNQLTEVAWLRRAPILSN
jgi:putative NADH-flavin reductase